jgi:DNA repair protein RadC
MDITVPCCVREVEVKYKILTKLPESIQIHNSAEIYTLFKDIFIAERVEVFRSILLNSKNKIMCLDTVSRGSLNTSLVHPREVFSNPVRLQTAGIIFVHNHPSGDPVPSKEDRECTQRLYKSGKILGIKVLDHIIFGESNYYSFADSGILNILDTEDNSIS